MPQSASDCTVPRESCRVKRRANTDQTGTQRESGLHRANGQPASLSANSSSPHSGETCRSRPAEKHTHGHGCTGAPWKRTNTHTATREVRTGVGWEPFNAVRSTLHNSILSSAKKLDISNVKYRPRHMGSCKGVLGSICRSSASLTQHPCQSL